jgi:hypothetical protein
MPVQLDRDGKWRANFLFDAAGLTTLSYCFVTNGQSPHHKLPQGRAIDLLHCTEHRRTTRAMGNPTQKMCMTTPITNSCKENGYFMAPERGTTTRFMKK